MQVQNLNEILLQVSPALYHLTMLFNELLQGYL